ncbi:unnamed protein product [Prunus brigantina]
MVKASEFSEGQDEEEDDARTVESDPGFKIGSLIYQRIIYMYPMLHKLKANNGNGTLKPLNISKSSICSINRNPADFNGYMIRGEDLKFGKRIPFSRRHGLVKVDQHKWQRNMKALYNLLMISNLIIYEFYYILQGKLFQEKAREVDEESNEMILRTRNIEIQGETMLDYCMDIFFFQEKAREVDNESNEISLDEVE